MAKIHKLKRVIRQRLSAAAEEIFELFEGTIAEYEEQLCRSKEAQHKLLDTVFNPEVRLYRADIQKLLVRDKLPQKRSSPKPLSAKKERLTKKEKELEGDGDIIKFTFNPETEIDEDGDQDVQQLMETSSRLDQEKDPPDPPHVKKEEEGEQLQAPEGANIKTDDDEEEEGKPQPSLLHLNQAEELQQLSASKEEQQEQNLILDQEDKPDLPQIKEEWVWPKGLEDADIKPEFIPAPLKIDKDEFEEKPQSSQLHPNQTEENSEAESEDCGGSEESSSEFDTDDSNAWEETGVPQPASQQDKDAPVGEKESNTGQASVNLPEKAKRSKRKKKKTDTVYKCKVCGKTYQRKRFYRRHYTRFHLIGPKYFPCSLCKKKFKCKGGLIGHMREHTGERPYKCGQCEKSFKRLGALKVHILYHTGEKPFTCNICEKGFRSHVLMTQHRQIHTGQGLVCSLCDITFRTKKKYYKHMTMHAREKPFSCTVCEKSFLSKETLTRHMTIHRNEKSFSCNVCHRSYTASYIKNHKCRQAKPDRIWCDACNKNFVASYHKHHKCKAKEGKKSEGAEEGLNLSKQQEPAGDSQEVSDQYVVPGGQSSSDQQQMFIVIQRSPVITSVGSHINLLNMQNYTEPQSPSVDLSNYEYFADMDDDTVLHE